MSESNTASILKQLIQARDDLDHHKREYDLVIKQRDMAITMLADWASAVNEDKYDGWMEHFYNVWCVESKERKCLITPLIQVEYGKARKINMECRHCGASMTVRKDSSHDGSFCQKCVDSCFVSPHIIEGADTTYKLGIMEV